MATVDHALRLLRVSARRVLLLLLAAGAASAMSIFLQPVIVGSAVDHTAGDLMFADAIFAQMSLDVFMLPELHSNTLPTNLDATTAGVDLFLEDSTWQVGPVLTVWYVPLIAATSNVRGISFGDKIGTTVRYGVAVANSYANDTLAHEVAHVLLNFNCGTVCNSSPDTAHASDAYNLVASGSNRVTPATTANLWGQGGLDDQLTASQISLILADKTGFLQSPEPAAAVLFVSGTALVLLVRRRSGTSTS